MKYLLLDANIYLSIAIRRRKDINHKLIDDFSNLLSYGNVRLLIPRIVIRETEKHLEDEINKIYSNLKECKNILEDKLYWFTSLENLSFEKNKKDILKTIEKFINDFDSKRLTYYAGIKDSMKKIFNHQNAIILEDKQSFYQNVIKRDIYKRAPCHKNKISFGDALILENLLNVKNIVSIAKNDKIYFITDNYKDFSKNGENKDILHNDIIEDLIEYGLDENVIYRTDFSNCIKNDFIEEFRNIENLINELIEEYEYQEKMMIEEQQFEENDYNRSLFGLRPLSYYNEDNIQEYINENDKTLELLSSLENINDNQSSFEDILSIYEDLVNLLETDVDEQDLEWNSKFLTAFNKILLTNNINLNFIDLSEIIDWINVQIKLINDENTNGINIDYLIIGEDIEFNDHQGNQFDLSWGNTNISPENGVTDYIYLYLKKNGEKITNGYIEITYGEAEFDEENNAGHGMQDEILIYFDEINEEINKIFLSEKEELRKHKQLTEQIQRFILNIFTRN